MHTGAVALPEIRNPQSEALLDPDTLAVYNF